MKPLDKLQKDIITWSSEASANLSLNQQKELYKKLIQEEYKEFLDAETEAEEYSEIMDLLWVLIIYCHLKRYSIHKGLKALTESNNLKLISPEYNENGKLLKGKFYVRPNWWRILKESRMKLRY